MASGTELKLYLNGALDGSANQTIAPAASAYPLRFGGISPTDVLHGLLDEISLYNRALGANEIAAIYAASVLVKCKSSGKSPPVIAGVSYNAAGMHIIIQTLPCYTYALECKDNLLDPTWSTCQTATITIGTTSFLIPHRRQPPASIACG